MKKKAHLASITILIKDRQASAPELNQILSENGHIIIGRQGLNLVRACIKNCTGLITIAVEAPLKEINELTKKLDNLYGIAAKSSIMTN